MSRTPPCRTPQNRLAVAILAGLFAAHPAVAATRLVTACSDSGAGGLRQAIAAAASGDIVDMTALACSKLTLTDGELPVTVNSLSIAGPGASQLTIDASAQSRILRHDGAGTLGLSGLTFAHGLSSGRTAQLGGCVQSNGNVSAVDVVLTHCVADSEIAANGGAIFAKGDIALVRSRVTASRAHSVSGAARGGGVYAADDVNIKYSTIDANVANCDFPGIFGTKLSAYGGGLFVLGGGTLRGDTISGNRAYIGGGGVFGVSDGLIDIVNSTISGNTAYGQIGGLSLHAATVSNSTIAFNIEGEKYASGVYVADSGNIDMQSSIIAMNRALDSALGIDFRAGNHAIVTGSHNLIRRSVSALPADTLDDDPLLGTLADNGGATLTHALQAGSPAIDAGNNTVPLSSDQRGSGFPRVKGMAADIGAYEFDDTIFVDGFD
jgi:hypothetical protein